MLSDQKASEFLCVVWSAWVRLRLDGPSERLKGLASELNYGLSQKLMTIDYNDIYSFLFDPSIIFTSYPGVGPSHSYDNYPVFDLGYNANQA